ncbi:MAG: hypothetical protein COY58_00585 [Gammaproteobacteria bacterium CG_4_10_14_0_8_um_filter_38_16]|nr:MAG: hypothetical protein COY58_00585 [Gammaproteobacteria bacterium CG_4_10_14_0_8_um_filter_38_16]PJA04255.1 MAG: hypothetical protein COX72_01385 [Gammaproteobacteria bacterium CG_4_10_14_0_2_um_filter_38_22]PJB10917.1 MAG: hypothetical protein CO120_02240 [Gammaproteobacteria bacterium CG_4_9_14_3_um_filter_38_9]
MNTNKITGELMPTEVFKIIETDHINIANLLDVFEGKIAGCLFRGAIDPEACKIITENFWNSTHLRKRSDGVPGNFLGTYHYKKLLNDYLRESEYFNSVLPSIFSNTENIFQRILDMLQLNLHSTQKNIRPAKHGTQEACHFFMRSWPGQMAEDYALAPHDDGAQCTDKKQAGFEIQTTINSPIVAANFCIENVGGGNLHYWNIQPDNQTKKMLGVEETGYPYPAKSLQEFTMIDLDINAGDIYFFNGKNIHAVSSPKTQESHRTTISCLMGKNQNEDIIYWT